MKTMNKKIDYTTISHGDLLNIVISGCKFKYASYDFKAAYKELQEIKPHIFTDLDADESKLTAEFCMPEELKEKYRVWRIGKLRRIHFNPNGTAWKFEIGARRAKSFYKSDFGVSVIPLIKT